MTEPFVHSNYQRREHDDYQTIDPRCVQALIETCPWLAGSVIDPCAAHGSGIVDELFRLGYRSDCADSVETMPACSWIVTNPPYDLRVVDEIAHKIVAQVGKQVVGAAMLMRTSWDLAMRRAPLFGTPLYRGQIRLRFRPWWSEERKAQPIHAYSWHVWMKGKGEPVVRYWPK